MTMRLRMIAVFVVGHKIGGVNVGPISCFALAH